MYNTGQESPIGNVFKAIFWFVQITDLHISDNTAPSRITDLKNFCSVTLPLIRPELVLATGDLTNARSKDGLSGGQRIEEWIAYRRIIRDSGILDFTEWLDVRGNHDTFNVVRNNNTIDYFNYYSIQGPKHPQGYSFQLQKPYGKYTFCTLEITPDYGINYPINFFGEINKKFEQRIRELGKVSEGSNHTFWFGHYPTPTIISKHFDLRGYFRSHASAYFCGHMHTVHGLLPHLYAVQPQGYLELELGDWRDNRYYRVVAVDHDLVSFTDVQARFDKESKQWPIILITNPKDARYLLPDREPTYRIAKSTHIRILTWSTSAIRSVIVFIDDQFQGRAVECKAEENKKTPLYTLGWNATEWSDGKLHQIQVTVIDADGNKRTVKQPFMVDGSPSWNRWSVQALIMRTNLTRDAQIAFYIIWSLLVLLLLLPRILSGSTFLTITCNTCFSRGVYKLAKSDGTFWPMLLFLIYMICGPTFMGYLSGGRFGAVFSFGICIGNRLILDTFTYLFEFYQFLILFVGGLCFQFCYAGRRSRVPAQPPMKKNSTCSSDTLSMNEIPGCIFSIVVGTSTALIHWRLYAILQFFFNLFAIAVPYGLLAFILAPGRWLPIYVIWNNACYLCSS
ncbi:unnamed protein product [Calicophoron daubneyi]|uniref:Calcineurin-like phosphoesterase domain-containing protein n=1 Tax=Calicophoron daubneyi TaxID=300641 RepID=A0AAV2T671_CALDB